MTWYKRHRLADLFALLLLVWATFVSCTGQEADPIAIGPDFMPLETGRFITYEVTEQRYSLTADPATLTYQLKETVGERYTDVTGQPAYRLRRFRRPNPQTAWVADSLWSAQLSSRAAIRTEQGIAYVKLIFPVQEHDRWDGNQLNFYGERLYQARQAGQSYTVNNKSFAQTVQVIEQDDSTLVSREKQLAVYARQVGLIYRERTQLQYCTTTSCIGKAQINYGTRQLFRVMDYGIE